MSEVFRVGDTVVLYADFRVNATGALTDPDTVTLKVRVPSATTTTYTYVGTTITKTSTGKYTRSISLTEAGIWAYQWAGTGAVAKVEEGTIEVVPSDYGF
jgi:hypothetical protein